MSETSDMVRQWADFLQRVGYPFDFSFRDEAQRPILPPDEVLECLAQLWFEREGQRDDLDTYRIIVFDEAGASPPDRD